MRERHAERGTATPVAQHAKAPERLDGHRGGGLGIAGGHLRARAELAQAPLGLAGGGPAALPGQRQGERELRACLPEGIAELVPDRDGLLERRVARALGRARQALELERLGHAGAIAAPARRRPGLRGRPRGAPAVGGGQRDVADGEQGGGLAHAGPVARGALGDGAPPARGRRRRARARGRRARARAPAGRPWRRRAAPPPRRRRARAPRRRARGRRRRGCPTGRRRRRSPAAGRSGARRRGRRSPPPDGRGAGATRRGWSAPGRGRRRTRRGRPGGWRGPARRSRPRRRPPPGCASRG